MTFASLEKTKIIELDFQVNKLIKIGLDGKNTEQKYGKISFSSTDSVKRTTKNQPLVKFRMRLNPMEKVTEAT